MSNLDELFCHVDDWTQKFELQWRQKLLSNGVNRRMRAKSLCLSEIIDHDYSDCFPSKSLS